MKGYTQYPLEGVSFAATFDDAGRDDRQADAVLLDGRHPGDLAPGLEGRCASRRPRRTCGPTTPPSAGSCSTPTNDPSECHDLAEQQPEKLQELIELWWARGGPYSALPLENRNVVEILTTDRPQLTKPRNRYVYYPGGRRGARVGRAEHPQPLLHDRRRGRRSTPRRPAASCSRTAPGSAATPCTSRTASSSTSTTSSAIDEQVVESTEPVPTGRHVVSRPPSSARATRCPPRAR